MRRRRGLGSLQRAQGRDQLIASVRVLESVDQALKPLLVQLRRRRPFGRDLRARGGLGRRFGGLRQSDRRDRQQPSERNDQPPGLEDSDHSGPSALHAGNVRTKLGL